MANCHLNIRRLGFGVVLLALAVASPACGGAGGGQGPGGAGQGLVLVSFLQAGVDNVPLNEVLEFRFSEPVNAATITPASIQIREGNAFGATVAGTFEVQGSVVLFRPQLPSLCDLSDAGFDADTQYRVQIIGWPEEFAVQNTQGQKLNQTTTWEFHTRDDQDPQKFTDAVPATPPSVTLASPLNGTAAVSVGSAANRQRIVLTMSENLDPCSVHTGTVRVEIYERGDFGTFTTAPNNNPSGFDDGGGDVSDQDTGDVTTWGSNGTPWPGGPQQLPATVHLIQDFTKTEIVISPLFGQDPANPELGGIFPDNVLIVVRLTFGIEDFAGQSLLPFAMSFTTENTNASPASYTILAEGETPFDGNGSTADINTARAPSKIQGFMLFAGDGDNGGSLTDPSLPNDPGTGCAFPFQANDGVKDAFDPPSDTTLDTGAVNTCINVTDGSTAVVWEFLSLRVRSGVKIRIIGQNPAILLVQGDAVVEANGEISVLGDGGGGSLTGNGGNGNNTNSSTNPTARPGGKGYAGGGDGGTPSTSHTTPGSAGRSGFGSPSGQGTIGGTGGGQPGKGSERSTFAGAAGGGSAGGGGGGHSTAGIDGQEPANTGTNTTLTSAATGLGGGTYPAGANAVLMLTPSAGSGGGPAGYHNYPTSFGGYKSTGGAGGAGGGFLDITASGDISVFGTIRAHGGRGGGGAGASFYSASGGGGGGSGGGIRLLTPNDINITGGTLTAAGGAGGGGTNGTGGGQLSGFGGAGGVGRLVMEDGDSVIAGFGAATTVPTDGDDGFHRGTFDASRFQGGGLAPEALTEIIFMGPLNPTYTNPAQGDFVAGAPAISSPGVGSTVILIEARGYEILPDGSADLGSATGWGTVGWFDDSGNESLPDYVPSGGLSPFNGYEFLQFRFTITLDSGVGPFDPGAFIDTWTINFSSNN